MTAPGAFSSGDVLTAADMNALPGAVMGWDTVTSFTSLTTSPLTTHSVTYTRQSGRLYVVMFSGLLDGNSVSGAEFRFDISQSGTRRYAGRYDTNTSSQQLSCNAMLRTANVGAGSETIIVECSMSTGTGTLSASSTNFSTLVVLDVGPL